MMTVSPNKQPMLQGWRIVSFQNFAAKMSSTSDSQILQTQTNTHLLFQVTYLPPMDMSGWRDKLSQFSKQIKFKMSLSLKNIKQIEPAIQKSPNKNFPEQPFWVKFFQRPGVLVTSLTQVVHPIIWIIHATAHPLTKTLSCATSGVSLTKNLDEHVFELILNLF